MFIVNDIARTYREVDDQPEQLPVGERVWLDGGAEPATLGYVPVVLDDSGEMPPEDVSEWRPISADDAPLKQRPMTAYDVDREELLFLEIQHVAAQEHISRAARLTRIRELIEALPQ